MNDLTQRFHSSLGAIDLPSVIVGSIISGLVLGGLAIAISTTVSAGAAAEEQLATSATLKNMHTALQRDANQGMVLEATAQHLELYLNNNETCRISEWRIQGNEQGGQTLTNTVSAYEDQVGCDGELQVAQTLSMPVNEASFLVETRTGRHIEVHDRETTFLREDDISTESGDWVEEANRDRVPSLFTVSSEEVHFAGRTY